jgi:acyl carrier protein
VIALVAADHSNGMRNEIDPRVASPVWWAIAMHLELQPEEIAAEQELRTDLGLDGLDLALIAMRIGDWLRVDVPRRLAEESITVGDWARAIVTMTAELDEDGRPSAPPSVRTQSGLVRVAPAVTAIALRRSAG